MTIHPFSTTPFLLLSALLCASPTFGQFLGPKPIYTESVKNIKSVTPTDLDGDGDLDLVFSDDGKGIWMRNDGAGGLSDPIVFYDVPEQAVLRVFPAGDLNGDGKEDMLIHHYQANGTQLLASFLNDGSEHIGQENTVWASVPNATNGGLLDFYTADMDLDGKLDLIFGVDANGPERLSWRRNTGAGYYAGGYEIAVFTFQSTQAIADLDGDGDADVLDYENGINNWIFWLKNPGDGDFQVTSAMQAFPLTWGFSALKTFDLDQDGHSDAVIPGPGKISFFVNAGNGVFTPSLVLTDSSDTENYYSITFGDVDNDGWQDILFAQNGYTGWFRNEGGSGSFSVQPRSFSNIGALTMAADWNGDGFIDLIISNYHGTSVSLNDGTGRFGYSESLVPKIGPIYSSQSADADGDGDKDLFAITDGRVYFFKNEGGGQFGVPKTAAHEISYYSTTFLLADFDGDTLPDMLTTDGEVAVYHNLGEGTFDKPTFLGISGSFPFLQPFDLDSDGDLDLVGTAYYNNGDNTWYKNDGAAHFEAVDYLPIDPLMGIGFVYFADYDGDALPEIVLFDYNNQEVSRYPNLGGGNFGPPQAMGQNVGKPILLADLNNDHIPDVLVATETQLFWHPGLPQGSLGPPQLLYDYEENANIQGNWKVGDLDADGDPDLVFSRHFPIAVGIDSRMIWLENDGSGNFTTHINPVREEYVGTLNLVDVDEDGFPDVVKSYSDNSNPSFGAIVWFKNYLTAPYISGYCFFDANENKQPDSLEALLRNIRLVLEPSAPYAFSEQDGTFRFYVEPGDYTLSYLTNNCWTLTTDSAAFQLQFADSLVTDLAFGFKSATDTAFAEVFIAGAPARCATEVPYWITLFNHSCNVALGQVAVLPDSLLSFISAEPMPDVVQGDTLFWAFDSLQPTEFRTIEVFFEVAGSEHTGDTTRLNAWVYSGATPNASTLTGNVAWPADIRCAFDPNDKLVQRDSLPIDYIATKNELLYTVRFQNTGNHTASQVIIRDQLDPTLDWQSFEPLGSSHPYRATLDLTLGEVVFTFEDIALPDSNSNEPASHGFVQFTILPKPGLGPGTILPNTASIYFDANPPVLTNEVETRIQTTVEASKIETDTHMMISPNPNSGAFSIELPTPAMLGMSFRITDLAGRLVLEKPTIPGSKQQTVEAGVLPDGLYFLQVVSGGVVRAVGKFVKQ